MRTCGPQCSPRCRPRTAAPPSGPSRSGSPPHPAAPSGALIRQRLCGHEGGSWFETVATALAVLREPDSFDPAWVQAVTAPRGWDADPAQEDPLDHVRAAIAALGPRITTARYAAWARENGRPTVATLQRRTGTV